MEEYGEEYGDSLLPYLFEVDDEIKENSEQLTLKSIDDARLVLCFITLRLNSIRNSKVAINKLIPEILYNIFTLVVYTDRYGSPEMAIMNISHVCRYWRQSALGWPALWAFLVLNRRSPSFFELFVERSQNAPLTLFWKANEDDPVFEYSGSKSYFMSHPNSILSRTHSLIVKTTFTHFTLLHRGLLNSALPFQLRRLDITLYRDLYGGRHDKPVLPSITHMIDNSFLREIKLEGFSLPWLQIPHNKLTCLRLIKLMNPPALSHLLVFLSNCPSLKVLELDFEDLDTYREKLAFDTRPSTSLSSQSTVNELDFPDLTDLELKAWGPSSYDFIQHFSRRIRTLRSLSQFKLFYRLQIFQFPDTPNSTTSSDMEQQDDDDPTSSFPSLRVLEAVPPETLSNFSSYRYLDISFKDSPGRLKIYGYMDPSDCPEETFEICPLAIECQGCPDEVDYSFILELGHSMPQVQHLKLREAAWVALTLPNLEVDFRRVFPSLHTLEFTDCVTQALKSIPADLRLKKLILESCVLSYKVLVDVALRMGIEVLELVGRTLDIDEDYGNNEYYGDVLSALRGKVVVVSKSLSGFVTSCV